VLQVSRKKHLINVPVRKPPGNVYFRVHPDPGWSLDASIIIGDGGSDDFLFVTPFMLNHHTMLPRLRRVIITVVFSWPGAELSLWPCPQLGERNIACWKSMNAARELAKTTWTQLTWNEAARDFDVVTAEGSLPAPTWPTDKTFADLLRLGFADKIIANENHPYVLRLRGLAD
jgi:hypothetical protein